MVYDAQQCQACQDLDAVCRQRIHDMEIQLHDWVQEQAQGNFEHAKEYGTVFSTLSRTKKAWSQNRTDYRFWCDGRDPGDLPRPHFSAAEPLDALGNNASSPTCWIVSCFF